MYTLLLIFIYTYRQVRLEDLVVPVLVLAVLLARRLLRAVLEVGGEHLGHLQRGTLQHHTWTRGTSQLHIWQHHNNISLLLLFTR